MTELKYITIEEAKPQTVNLRGWAYRERKSIKFVFIVLRYKPEIIQYVIKTIKN